jgi:predicted N-acyltransferase
MDVPVDIVAPAFVAWALKRSGAMLRHIRYQKTLFVGSPFSDEGTVGIIAGKNFHEMAPLIQDELNVHARRCRASMIVWKDFSDETGLALESLCKSHGLFSLASYPGARLYLKETGFEGYIQSLRSNQRYQLKKKLRQSREMGRLDTCVIQRPDKETLDEIFDLFWQTYQRGKTKFERLTPTFFDKIASEPVSYFILLKDPATKRLVAFMLCFRTGKRVINKFIGLDYAYKGNWYLYFRLWEEAVAWAVRTGADEIQSGQTGYRAKLDIGHTLVPLTNYCRHVNPLIHGIFKWIAGGITWATLDDDLKNLKSGGPSP